MNNQRPLFIGAPFLYQLVDYSLLAELAIDPVLAYPKTAVAINNQNSVYYDELTIEAIGKIIQEQSIDAIVCFNDNFIIESAKLRSKFNLRGLKYPNAIRFKSKSVMYEYVKDKMRTPASLTYSGEDFEKIQSILGVGEYFIKPDNLAGAEGSFHLRNQQDFINWQNNYIQSDKKYIIQEYFEYPLVHCELIVKEGKVEYVHARQYSYPNHLFLQGKIIASLSISDQILKNKIEQYGIMVQELLEFKQGVMHTEFFVSEHQELIFLETNIRQAGGAINLIHYNRLGMSIETIMVLLEYNKDFTIKLHNDECYDIGGYIPLRSGTIQDIIIPQLQGQYQFDIRVNIGDNHNNPNSASNAAASFVGKAQNYADLYSDFARLENEGVVVYE